MKNRKVIMMLVFTIILQMISVAQTPESFFPSQVGNLWQYDRIDGPAVFDWKILRDSIASDSNRYLYIKILPNRGEYWWYRLDTTNVYQGDPTFGWDRRLYRLDADSGAIWNRAGPNYSWVAAVQQAWVFGVLTTIKVIRTGPHPDSGSGLWYWEEHLASGFGLVYAWEEPFYVSFLRGCVIAGDTFGTVVSVIPDERTIPEDLHLAQNYPNPFNPTTTMEFSLPQQTNVCLTVHDLLGREIAVLVDEKKRAGTYKVAFDGSTLPSSIYFARLQTPSMILMKKMTIFK